VAVVQVFAICFERFLLSDSIWHLLYFFPLPHQQGSFRPRSGMGSGLLKPKIFLMKLNQQSPLNRFASATYLHYLPHNFQNLLKITNYE